MPKQLRTIKQYHGGLIQDADPRDIPDNAATDLLNMVIDNVGRIQQSPITASKSLGSGAADYNAIDITYIKDATIRFDMGAEIYVFNSDKVLTGTSDTTNAGSITLVWMNPLSGWVYFYDWKAKATLTNHWITFAPKSIDALGTASNYAAGGIPAVIANLGLDTSEEAEVCYYSADGQLRVHNANFGAATYIGTNTSIGQGASHWVGSACDENGTTSHTALGETKCRYNLDYEHASYSSGSSSLWIGYIDKSYLSDSVTADEWHVYPGKIQTPIVGGTTTGVSIVSGEGVGNFTTEPGVGEIKIETEFTENGNGSLLLAGRKFYMSFTYDGVQESLPSTVVESIGGTLPVINESTLVRIEYGTEDNTALNEWTVATLADWPAKGSFTVEDEDGYEQLLSYDSITGNNTFVNVKGWYGDGGYEISGTIGPTAATESSVGGRTVLNSSTTAGMEIGDVVIISESSSNYIDGSWTVMNVVDDTHFEIGFDIDEDGNDVVDVVITAGDWQIGEDLHNIASGATLTLVRKDGDLGIEIKLHAHFLNNTQIFPDNIGGNRITGVNLYTNRMESDGVTIAEEDFAHVCSWDFQEGYLKPTNNYADWTEISTGIYACDAGGFISQFATSYEMRTGVNPRVRDINARFKTAVVTNRRVYAGNVLMMDKAGEETVYGDRMVKSPPGSLDVFPTGEFIDVAIRDGDEIVRLEEFSGKLLQFKKKALYVINISGDYEYLEQTYKYRGVDHAASVCRTDQGVAFVNDGGLFLYTGQEIIKLSEGKINIGAIYTKYKAYGAAGNPGMILSYDSTQHELVATIATKQHSSLLTIEYGTSFIYHFKTQSFSKMQRLNSQSGSLAQDNELSTISRPFYVDNRPHFYGQQKTESSGGASGYDTYTPTTDICKPFIVSGAYGGPRADNDMLWQSKDMSFGAEVQKKRIYGIRITYDTNGSTDASAQSIVDDITTYIGVQLILDGTPHDYYIEGGTDKWLNASTAQTTVNLYKDGAKSNIETCRVCAIKVYSDIDINASVMNKFKITDISVILRSIDRLT